MLCEVLAGVLGGENIDDLESTQHPPIRKHPAIPVTTLGDFSNKPGRVELQTSRCSGDSGESSSLKTLSRKLLCVVAWILRKMNRVMKKRNLRDQCPRFGGDLSSPCLQLVTACLGHSVDHPNGRRRFLQKMQIFVGNRRKPLEAMSLVPLGLFPPSVVRRLQVPPLAPCASCPSGLYFDSSEALLFADSSRDSEHFGQKLSKRRQVRGEVKGWDWTLLKSEETRALH